MFKEIKDEILTGDPRYIIQDDAGHVIEENVQITLTTPIRQEGTPLNKATLENIQGDLYIQDRYNTPTYSGSAMELTLPLTSYETNKIVKIIAPANLTNPTLNINGLGAKTVVGYLASGNYYELVYTGTQFKIVRGSEERTMTLSSVEFSSPYTVYTGKFEKGKPITFVTDLKHSASSTPVYDIYINDNRVATNVKTGKDGGYYAYIEIIPITNALARIHTFNVIGTNGIDWAVEETHGFIPVLSENTIVFDDAAGGVKFTGNIYMTRKHQ